MSGEPVVSRQMLGDASVGKGQQAVDTGRDQNGKPVFAVRPQPQMQGGSTNDKKLQQG